VAEINHHANLADEVFYEAFKSSPIGIVLDDMEGRSIISKKSGLRDLSANHALIPEEADTMKYQQWFRIANGVSQWLAQ
jgi:hypothetical protein